MINGKRIAVVMPAYNAEKTLEQTVRELSEVVDIKILVDDSSKDGTAASLPQARRADLCSRRQLRLWPQPADLLSRGTGGRRGHRGHGSSRLPVHAVAGSGDGGHDRQRRLRHGSGLADSGRRGVERRNAVLQIRRQPLADGIPKSVSGRQALGVPHRLPRLLARIAGDTCRCSKTPTILSSITR